MVHIPVLKEEVIRYLAPCSNENFIDCTIGEAGHTFAILRKNGPQGKILGIELDPELYQKLKLKIVKIPISNFQFLNRLILVNDSYTNLKKIVRENQFRPVHGIFFDLGMSTWHLKEAGRGFSFLKDEPLDMRYLIEKQKLTALKVINSWPPQEIERILADYGEEKFAKRITEEIVKQRKTKPIKTTFELVEIVKKSVPARHPRRKIHPATKTFQALRIAVNDELNNLTKGLQAALEILEPQAKLVVISFHSLEDRMVKIFLKNNKNQLKILTKKPVRPSPEEIKLNPSARSAKLRAGLKITNNYNQNGPEI